MREIINVRKVSRTKVRRAPQSQVYFIAVKHSDDRQIIQSKLAQLLQQCHLFDCIAPGDKVVIKIHFGEAGNTGYVRPEYIRVVHDAIVQKQAQSVLSDTNTLYRGKRLNSHQHRELAYEHGFTPDIVGAQVVIPDDTREENIASIAVNQRLIKVAKIAKLFLQADVILGVAHFKGHMMTGFGGALKNIAMGCATREGKLAQHSDVSPYVIHKKCVNCAACQAVCPVAAIRIKRKKAYIDNAKCIGCASCIAACGYNAIDVDWEAGGEVIQEKMIEYAKAVLDQKKNKTIFLNFAIKITKECDCLAKDDPRIVPDIGILASSDPVSIDQASMDLVNQAAGRDIFRELHPNRDGCKQLHLASKLGLGNLDYDLIEL